MMMTCGATLVVTPSARMRMIAIDDNRFLEVAYIIIIIIE